MSAKLANIMGYEYAIMFPRARDAVSAYVEITGKRHPIPANVCPALRDAMGGELVPVDPTNGLAPGVPVQLYGFRQIVPGAELEIDPLMTGCMGVPFANHSIASFGYSKTIDLGAGGAFLTNDMPLANEMDERAWFPPLLSEPLSAALEKLHETIKAKFEIFYGAEAIAGDMLVRPSLRPVIPWRLVRLAHDRADRDAIVSATRRSGKPIGTNYPSLLGGDDQWGDRVINYFLDSKV